MGQILILAAVIIPIAGGLLLHLLNLRSDKARNVYCEAVAVITSVLVWAAILTGPHGSFRILRFTGDFYVALHMDGMSMLFAGMVSLMWPLVLIYAFDYMSHAKHKKGFFAFYMMTYGVTLGVACAANIVTLYLFYEFLTIVTIPLVAHYRDHESMHVGRVYAGYVIGGASASLVAVVFATMHGAGSFAHGGSAITGVSLGIIEAVYLFGFFGLGVKAAIFPLYKWLPMASVAPTPVTALLHAVAVVNSGVFAVTRLTYYVFGPETLKGTWTQYLCLLVVSFNIVFAAVQAVRERHFKRRLAYSTVANLSYMLYGIMLMSDAGFTAGMSHMVFHGVTKIALFMCAGAFMHVTGDKYIYEINGVGKRMPVTFALYTIGSLSLIGIPLFCGFVSKWALFTAGAAEGSPFAVAGIVALIIGAFLTGMYTLSVTFRAFMPMNGTDRYVGAKVSDANWKILVPIGIFAALTVVFGIFPGPIMDLLSRIAAGAL
ncbi:MAG: proton-conducting membrane transporter [Lachnospiraceae bacterium]|nr:proton-conducting membrane transporter [Lachnospiraceae bacterium]